MSDKLKKELETLLEAASERDAIRSALESLLPNLFERTYSTRSERALERRFFHPHFAPIYFALDPSQGVWTKDQMSNALSGDNPEQVLDLFLETLSKAPKQSHKSIKNVFVDTLDDILASPSVDLVSWYKVIFANTLALFSHDDGVTREFFGISLRDRLRSILVRKLNDLPRETQYRAIEEAIRSSDDLSLVSEVLRGFFGDVTDGGASSSFEQKLNEVEREQLRNALLLRIRERVELGQFWEQLWPGDILWFWRNSGNEIEVIQFTNSELRRRSGVQGLMKATVHRVLSTGGNYDVVNRKSWSKIVNLDSLKAEAEKLESSGDTNLTADANRFLIALKKGEEEPDF